MAENARKMAVTHRIHPRTRQMTAMLMNGTSIGFAQIAVDTPKGSGKDSIYGIKKDVLEKQSKR